MALFKIYSRKDQVVRFDAEVSHHLQKSVRKNVGDRIYATDGEGMIFLTEITGLGRGTAEGRILEETEQRPECEVTIACSLIKKESRFENFLEKSTELGVREIVPLICERTLKRNMRSERSMKILSAAAQQAFNAWLPDLCAPVRLEDFLTGNKYEGYERFIATAVERHEVRRLEEVCSGQKPVVVLIGPEGDFSDAEKGEAVSAGWLPVSLGPTRLRTETAAMMTVQIVKSCCRIKKKGE